MSNRRILLAWVLASVIFVMAVGDHPRLAGMVMVITMLRSIPAEAWRPARPARQANQMRGFPR